MTSPLVTNIAIVGGGIVGLSCAEHLSRWAEGIVIVDPHPPGKGASWGNMGALAFGEVLPMARPAMIFQAARWLSDPLGPVAVSNRGLSRNLRWFKSFVSAAFDGRYESRVAALSMLNALSEDAWEQVLGNSPLWSRCVHDKVLHVYGSRGQFEKDKDLWRARERAGHPALEVSADQAVESGVAAGAVGAALETPSWRLSPDPYLLSAELEGMCRARQVEVVADEATGFRDQDGRVVLSCREGEIVCNTLVIAAGIGSRGLAARLGDHVPVIAERGYSYTLPQDLPGPAKYTVFRSHGFVVSPLECGVRVGGSAEFVDAAAPPNWKRLDVILNKARELLPGLTLDRGQRWFGDRPSTPDSLPVIGRSPRCSNVVYAFGHGHLGVTQAAATGRIVSDIIRGVQPPIDPQPFRPDRFR